MVTASSTTDAPAGSLTPDAEAPSRYLPGLLLAVCNFAAGGEAIAHLSLQNIRTADWSTAVAPFGMW